MTQRMKVLIGYDGSIYADAAIDGLQWAGLPPLGDALIVTIGNALFTPPLASHEILEKAVATRRITSAIALAQDQEAKALRQAQWLAPRAARRVQERQSGWTVLPKALAGSPSQELLREAERMKPDDLIVVGSHGRSALGRLLLGSVSRTVASDAPCSDAPCSVRIVRRAMGKISKAVRPRIIIGVDGPFGAARAVRAVGMRVAEGDRGAPYRSQRWKQSRQETRRSAKPGGAGYGLE